MDRIKSLSNRIAKEFRPDRIILFGSYAYGKPTLDSDVDLLIIMPFRGSSARKAAEILTRLEPKFSVDILVRTQAQVRKRVAMDDWFMQEIVGQGRVLYEANHS
ncbi:MAG TPA: nucleotidyltransferase domain-containing protein [Pyrinomonadaceae bacterium]|nr:nucleotidyltransferase domain-containing protein [Pyrinomonadaceae bacterium]